VFERYTEKARRAIFFALYEARHFDSPCIEAEHLLLGLLRDNSHLLHLLPEGSLESIRTQIEKNTLIGKGVSTSADLPLSNESKRVLAYAAEEADRLGHRHIGSEHLLMGLLREYRSFAAALLQERGLSLQKLRDHFMPAKAAENAPPRFQPVQHRVEIHGFGWHADTIRERVKGLRQCNWHWQKQPWKARDLAVGQDGKISFDTSLAGDEKQFTLRPGEWKKDQCPICNWELFESESEPHHSIGYTNGRDWVCTECYEKFLSGPDYFASSFPEFT
jgi:ATP-dependent Clp protease ATP-binding subunit ClpC